MSQAFLVASLAVALLAVGLAAYSGFRRLERHLAAASAPDGRGG